MDITKINLIREYMKKKNWKEAMEVFETSMNEKEIYPEEYYLLYGRSLRFSNRGRDAQIILERAYNIYPENEDILKEAYRVCNQLGDWEKAICVSKKLINIDPDNKEYYLRSGRAYSWSGDKINAKEMYKQVLLLTHDTSFNHIIKKVQKGFMDTPDKEKAKYVLPGGMNNLGMIFHEDKERSYVTKITYAKEDKKERLFYTELLNEFPQLQQVVPLFIDLKTLDNIQYLTIEMLGKGKGVPLSDVIKTSQQLSKVKYNSIVNLFPNDQYPYVLKKRANFITPFFTQIHKKSYNEKLFKDFKRFIDRNIYVPQDIEIINRMEDLILDNELYLWINPEKHYSLIHGDFKLPNIGENQNGELKVFDWSGFKIAPHFIDIARYFQATSTSYSDVRKNYLFNESLDRKLSTIERVFFLYAFILFHFIILSKNNRDEKINKYILPALMDMDMLVNKFKNVDPEFNQKLMESFINNYDMLLKANNKLKKQNKEYKQSVSKVNEEKSTLNNKLQGLLNSKSWKITAPLRKLTSGRGNHKGH